MAYCWNHRSWRRRGWWWPDWIFGGRSFAAEVQSFHELVFGGAEGDETLHRLSHCDLSRWCGAEEGGGGGAVVGGVFRGNLIAGCVEALFALDLPSSLPFFSFLECCCWFVYNTAAISSDADNLCWRAFGWKGKQPCIVYAGPLLSILIMMMEHPPSGGGRQCWGGAM